MFRKIFKYDFRACSRIMLLLIPLTWLLAGFAAMLIRAMEMDFFQEFFILETSAAIGIFFSIMAICCFPVAVLIFCLRRYYTHFFSDEGYLTFTLPVKRETLLWSKTLSAFLTMAIAAVAEVIAFLLLIALLPGGMDSLWNIVEELWKAARAPGVWEMILLVIAIVIASGFGSLALMHFCMTQGFLLAKKHRVLAAFGLWYGINFVKSTISQIASLLFLIFLSNNVAIFPGGALEVPGNDLVSGVMSATNGYIGIALVVETACFFGFYFWNQHLLKAKLSLA